jgi:hypothetical protein
MSKRKKWLDPFSNISSVQKGKAAEYLVISKLLLQGFDCYIPATESSKADILVDNGRKILKAQVKIIGHNDSLPVRKISVNSKTNTKVSMYTEKDIDVFIGVDLQKLEIFVIPIDFIQKFRSLISKTRLINEQFLENYDLLR